MVLIGINGFGCLGRCLLRICMQKGLPVTAINNPFTPPEYMADMLRYDTRYGRFNGEVKVIGSCMIVDGHRIDTYQEEKPEKIPWKELCAQYIIEASGNFTSVEQACGHLVGGATKVIITASSDAPMFVYGVNHKDYKIGTQVISGASGTMNALAPLAKMIHDNFEICEGFITTVHSVTASQKTADSAATKFSLRNNRAAFQNIIPVHTDTARDIGEIISSLEGKLSGVGIKVPVANSSVLDLTVRLGTDVTYEEIMSKIKRETETHYKGILGYTEEELASCDFLNNPLSFICDAKAGVMLTNNFVKLIGWYDDEYAYSCRLVELIKHISKLERCSDEYIM